jgi:hypothetical protein
MDGERGRDLFRQVASRSTDVDVDVLYNRRVAMQEADESYQQARADAETAEMFESWNSAAGLVHRIQRERGATCSWVATSGSTLMEPSALKTLNSHSLVLDLRKRTNACIAAGQHKITPAAADKLREVRELADLAGSIRSESSLASRPALDLARRFCLVFNKYTELIADMLSEVVFKRDTGCERTARRRARGRAWAAVAPERAARLPPALVLLRMPAHARIPVRSDRCRSWSGSRSSTASSAA